MKIEICQGSREFEQLLKKADELVKIFKVGRI
jgi:hypothetical protein